ncbi:uncharacterized protein PV06_03052 [Exophiala oligosperma]|uniref:Major facilitator superfamily (MFS) profile domain-containing protein n=2 Tax=Chaetothyriales TaxID=34395 RepID=A0A0D2DP47_9EURO|nr:uncharacterized protein PV06_03052 [Exophiala oligosperma]KAJ9639591.1 hypothetical protein H2204_003661 [Knufia peltigerae]KIW44593.1 hypothetical protein PV06_03052 [Exophiala oligosperma]
MDDDTRSNSGNTLRPLSQPAMNSRFPSLRRLNSTEPYRHRSLPAEPSPGSDRASSEITFAVLYDDGPDYHVGHYDEEGSMQTARNGRDSMNSYAPSFRTRDSRLVSDDNYLDRNPDFVANQRLLAEGYLNSNDSFYDQSVPRYPTQSEETLAMNALHNGYGRDEKRPLSQQMTPPMDRAQSKHSHESWCTCDEDHGHGHGLGMSDRKDPSKFDLESQNAPPTPTPFLPKEKGPGGPGGPGGPPGGDNPYKVQFEGPNDPLNPKNWPSKKKWAVTGLTASFTFLSPLASSMVAPAIPQIAKDFGITNTIEQQIVLSIFVLAYAIGPMFLGPLSELYGRVIILQSSNIIFLAFNTACGFAQTKEQLMAFRFLSGLGGSAPLAIGGGVLGDLFKPEERGKAMGIYAMGPLLGPAIGPVVGAWVAEKSTWRWMFYASSIVNLFILVGGFWKLRETYAPYILHKKAKLIRTRTGDNKYRADGEGEVDQPIWKKIAKTMGRSFGMLFTQPIVQVLALYMAFSYGILYLALSTYFELFLNVYHESVGISGLNYLSLGLGFFIGAPVCGKSGDKIYQKLKAKDPRGKGKPEYRMPLVIPFSLFVPTGLLVYGWSAQNVTHWIVPNIGAFLFGIGTIAAFQCVTTYLVDSYGPLAASAVAAVTILRSLAGFGFPLFAPAMYKALQYGWGNTVLALAAIGIGTPIPIMLWLFGEKLRKRSSLTMKGPPPGKGGPGGKGPGAPGGPPGGPMKGPGGPGGPGMGPGGIPSGPPPPFPGGPSNGPPGKH